MTILFQKDFDIGPLLGRVSVANELWYSTLVNGEKKYSVLHIGYNEHLTERLYVFVFLGLSIRFGIIK